MAHDNTAYCGAAQGNTALSPLIPAAFGRTALVEAALGHAWGERGLSVADSWAP